MRKMIPILLMTLALISASITLVNAQGEAPDDHFYFEPTSYDFSSNGMGLGDMFNATLYFNGTVDLFSWQIYVTFNGTLLNATDAGYLPDEPVHQGTSIPVAPDIGPDNVFFGVSSLLDSYDVTSETGLCYIEFEIIAEPPAGEVYESDLTLVPGPAAGKVTLWEDSEATTYYPDVTSGHYVVPEFPLLLIAPILMIATTIAVIFRKKY